MHISLNNIDVFCQRIFVYTPGQKFKTTIKKVEKDIVYNF